jgi:hypothetical protein
MIDEQRGDRAIGQRCERRQKDDGQDKDDERDDATRMTVAAMAQRQRPETKARMIEGQ